MIKKIISLIICTLLTVSACFGLSSCNTKIADDQFPVTVAGVTIEKEPENIVVLSDNLADIISLIGYDVKMVGRSMETDQEFLRVVPAMGSSEDPSVGEIVNAGTELVIADSTLSDNAKASFAEQNIPVLQLDRAETLEELEQLYADLGTALGGKEKGLEKGKKAYKDLFDTLDEFKSVVKTNTIKTCCYIYLDNNQLNTFKPGSLEETIFSYNSAMNVFQNNQDIAIQTDDIKIATPTYIFVSDDETENFIKTNINLQKLTSVKNGDVYIIPLKDFYRQGQTYIDIVYKMIDIMFVQSEATPGEATPDNAAADETQFETLSTETVSDYGEVNLDGPIE